MKSCTVKFLATAALLAVIASCVSIGGQRISWFHDQAKDTLEVLIHYDGIHEGSGRAEMGADQLPGFIENGDIMILDWWGHLRLGPIRAKLQNGNLLEKMVAKTLTSFEVRAVGHYTDPSGRIGALQLITIPKVSRFIKQLNELFCAAVITGVLAERSLPKTGELQKEAARNRHRWLALEGHAIHVRIPVHPDEAGRLKGQFLEGVVSRALVRATDEHKSLVRRIAQQIAEAPVSVIQEEEMLTLVFGYEKRTSTIRITARDDYNPDLVAAVKKNVPTDLDAAFAAALVARAAKSTPGEKSPSPPGLFGDLIAWGPPEDQVGALLRLAEAAGTAGKSLPQMTAAATRSKALGALAAFGEDWNGGGRMPAAPPEGGDADAFCRAWAQWYTAVTGVTPIDQDR